MKVKDLSQLGKKDVINLLNHIETMDSSKIAKYQSRLIDLNVTGLVLSICDLDNLQGELEMNFGDFQIFKALILYLRELESLKMVNLTDSEEIGEISPQIFDNLAFWTEPEHEINYGSDNDQSQLKSFSSSCNHRDTAPIISNDSKVLPDTEPVTKDQKKTKVKSNGKINKSSKSKQMTNHSPFHRNSRFQEHMHNQNPAYTSLSESVDKINSYCKKYSKNEYTTTYIPVIIPNTAEVPPDGDNVKRCTCDYWFTIGKEKVPLSRFISDPMNCLNSHGNSDDGSEDDEFNPRLSCILPDSVTTNKLS